MGTNTVSTDVCSHVVNLLTVVLHLLERLYVDLCGGVCFQPGLLSIIFIITRNGLGTHSAPVQWVTTFSF
jgi:hypothetical protein